MSSKTTYFVAGASRGIGYALVKLLSASSDNYVIGSYRSKATAGPLLELAKQENVDTVILDVSKEESISQLSTQLSALTDGIDVA